ncbi:hypothetical protein [Draconibacterium orientale]|uniref:hypothetical protein n=1 Tax=Draconibacterium orientale TaxID=1168034 RepID=UPI002A0A133C|nr:hypothetical protein [Draconibacterium orientale]
MTLVIKSKQILRKIRKYYLQKQNAKTPIRNRITIKIELYDQLDKTTLSAIDNIFKKVFNRTLSSDQEWHTPHLIAIAYLGNKIISIRYIIKTSALFDSKPVIVGGTGGLLTLPSYRGFGIAKKTFKYVDNHLFNQLNVECGLFICGEQLVHYYRKLGWYRSKSQLFYYKDNIRTELVEYCVMLKSKNNKYQPNIIEINGELW